MFVVQNPPSFVKWTGLLYKKRYIKIYLYNNIMPNYQNSKIYKIVSLSNPDKVYYGSTTKTLSQRMAHHKSFCKQNKPITSKEILQYDDAKIILVENYPCNSKEELLKKEYEYILNNQCINKQKGYTEEEYYEVNKDKILQRSKEYYENNKEDKLKYAKEYREKNRALCLERQKKYNSQKVKCEICQLELRKDSLNKHIKNIHKNFI